MSTPFTLVVITFLRIVSRIAALRPVPAALIALHLRNCCRRWKLGGCPSRPHCGNRSGRSRRYICRASCRSWSRSRGGLLRMPWSSRWNACSDVRCGGGPTYANACRSCRRSFTCAHHCLGRRNRWNVRINGTSIPITRSSIGCAARCTAAKPAAAPAGSAHLSYQLILNLPLISLISPAGLIPAQLHAKLTH